MTLGSAHTLYFLGIGGIGMSALARYFRGLGKVVKGYDRSESVVTRALVAEGIEVFYEMDAAQLAGVDLVVYTPAVPRDSLLYRTAEAQGLPIWKRAQVLGEISRQYRTLAVAGTHGKTTTSAMLAHLLRETGIDATAFLGGIARPLNSNFVAGQSDWLVVEADEYDRSFLTLHPELAIINSLDPDHLDIYGDEGEMRANYARFAAQASRLLVWNGIQGLDLPAETFGIGAGTYAAERIRYEGLSTRFDLRGPGLHLPDLRLRLPGQHNVLNMTAALAAALQAGAAPEQLPGAVASFAGIYRRFEILVHGDSLSYVDDYAHHPREIAAALDTARRLFPGRKLVVAFQPHLYSRTRDFAEGFAAELSRADALRMMDIYPARELPLPGVDSQMILDRMSLPDRALVSRAALPEALLQACDRPAVVLSLGAGDIDREVPRIQQACQARLMRPPAKKAPPAPPLL